jgi:ribosomal protein S18 acetylase RimI-like enzyme
MNDSEKAKIEIVTLPASKWKDYKEIRLSALKKDPSSFCMAYAKEAAYSDKKWKQSLQDSLEGKSWLYFARYYNKMVGVIGALGDELDLKNNRVYLWGLYVDEKFRGKGIARMLTNKLIFEIEKKENIRIVCLEVNPELVHAVCFYESLGFHRVDVESHIFCDGLSHNVLVMEKVLH